MSTDWCSGDGSPRVVGAVRAELGESPLWDPEGEAVVWTDILARTLHVTSASGRDRASRRAGPVGALAPHAAGGFVLAEGSHILHVGADLRTRELIAEVDLPPESRFNDGAVDPAGRFVVGVLSPGPGVLLSVEPDGRVQTVLDGIALTNGLDWSPDGRTLYHVDSVTARVDAYAYDVESGTLGARRTAVQVDGGLPDGLTVDAEGHLWVAIWGAGEVRRYAPDGSVLTALPLPVAHVTCPAFGGSALDTLFVTTARPGAGEADPLADPLAGALFAVPTSARGRPVTAFGRRPA